MQLRVNAATRQRLVAVQTQLADVRREAGMGRATLAELLGVKERSVRDWERCYDHPSTQNLVGWGYVFDLRLVFRELVIREPLVPVSLAHGETLVKHEMRRLASPLKKRRTEKGTSQTDLALTVGVSRSSLQRWEDCDQTPTVLCLATWADRLGFTVGLAAS